MQDEVLKIEDHRLELFGNMYRKHCGPNDVIVSVDGGKFKPFTFENFLSKIGANRDRPKNQEPVRRMDEICRFRKAVGLRPQYHACTKKHIRCTWDAVMLCEEPRPALAAIVLIVAIIALVAWL